MDLEVYYEIFLYKGTTKTIIDNKEYIIEIVRAPEIKKNINLYVFAIILKSPIIMELLKPLNKDLMIEAYNIITKGGKEVRNFNYIKFMLKYVDVVPICGRSFFAYLNIYREPEGFKSFMSFCKFIIKAGFDINYINAACIYENALYYVIGTNNIRLIELFVKNGIDLNPQYSMNKILWANINLRTIKYLLRNNIFNRMDLIESILYELRINKDTIGIIKYLIYKEGGKVNRKKFHKYYILLCRLSKLKIIYL
jgi:hypothetical protein